MLVSGADPTLSLGEVLAARCPAAFFGYRPEWTSRWYAVRKAVVAKFEERRRRSATA